MKRGLLGSCALILLGACAASQPGGDPVLAAPPPATAAANPEPPPPEGDPERGEDWGIVEGASYASVVDRVVQMVGDGEVIQGAQRRGLSVMNVMWEDTGRAQGSSIGPNITDLTLQVRFKRDGSEQQEAALMPVIRFPNFTDRTGDVPANKLFVRVGNHRKKDDLKTVPLADVLRNLRGFASKPWTIGGSGNLLAKRDTHFLVSAQAVFLPIPKAGKAEFNPVVFNYQSAPGSPAVLTLLATRQGTSIRVIENSPEESSVRGMGQELYFNEEGQRTAFTAERRSDVKQRIEAQGGPRSADDKSALAKGADLLMLVQVPLRHRSRGMLSGTSAPAAEAAAEMAEPAPAPAPPAKSAAGGAARPKSDVEQAVLGHGERRGPYSEGSGVVLERDPTFPIRITFQFYKATSNGVVDNANLDAIASTIGNVYEHAEFVGSLVVPEGDPVRPTEWQRIPGDWFRW